MVEHWFIDSWWANHPNIKPITLIYKWPHRHELDRDKLANIDVWTIVLESWFELRQTRLMTNVSIHLRIRDASIGTWLGITWLDRNDVRPSLAIINDDDDVTVDDVAILLRTRTNCPFQHHVAGYSYCLESNQDMIQLAYRFPAILVEHNLKPIYIRKKLILFNRSIQLPIPALTMPTTWYWDLIIWPSRS